MKKGIFLLTLIFILGCGSAGFAAELFNDSDDPAIADTTTAHDILDNFRCSKNVEIHVLASAQTYAARAAHLNGNREFGSASGDPKLCWIAKDTGTDASDPTASDSSEFDSGWSAL